jgi:hypothetical protein
VPETVKINPQSEAARAQVRAFCEYVVWLKSVHRIYVELFETERAERLLKQTALAFFSDINKVLIEYLLLAIARITDPAQTRADENFTVANLLQTIAWRAEIVPRLNELEGVLHEFRNHTKLARNKLIAHLDKRTFLGEEESVGAFPAGKDREALQALEDLCNLFHKESVGEILGSISVGLVGDVGDLKTWLARGLAFDTQFRDAVGDEKIKLFELMRTMRGD